ncbi:hypothetical protein M0R72_15240 [Candidatus Pacearchaeota archaeon]|nr:hypothetical protein [Candidatus Pacearchaeota archaeon]
MICIFEDCLGHKMGLHTARKKGTYTLSGGAKQQIWNCRECGRSFQTDASGKVVTRRKPTGKRTS